MADIYGSHFEYDSRSSREYGLVIAAAESERMRKRSGDTEGVFIFNKALNQRYLTDDIMSGSFLSFEVDILSVNQQPIVYEKRRKIEKWLLNRREFHRLYIDMADDPLCETYEYINGVIKRNYLNCRFINAEKLEYNGGVVGYRVILESDSDMFWQDETCINYDLDNQNPATGSSFIVEVDTDSKSYTYPVVTIKTGTTGGDVVFINNTDDENRLTKFVGLPPLAEITFRGGINYISGQYCDRFYKANFVRLLDGKNEFSVIGNVDSVTFRFQNRRAF